MNQFNKAWQGGTGGGLGAAIAVIIKWMIESGGETTVPENVEMALAVILAAIGGILIPMIGPANKG